MSGVRIFSEALNATEIAALKRQPRGVCTEVRGEGVIALAVTTCHY